MRYPQRFVLVALLGAFTVLVFPRVSYPCSPPGPYFEPFDDAKAFEAALRRVPADGLIVMHGSHLEHFPVELTVLDSLNQPVAGRLMSGPMLESELEAILWQADAPLSPGADYRLEFKTSYRGMDEASFTLTATESVTGPPPTASIVSLQLREIEASTDKICCEVRGCLSPRQRCWPRSHIHDSSYEVLVEWGIANEGLDARYVVGQVVPLGHDGEALRQMPLMRAPGASSTRTTAIAFPAARDEYCFVVESNSLFGDRPVHRSDRLCIDHTDLDPALADRVEPQTPRPALCIAGSLTVNGEPIAYPSPSTTTPNPSEPFEYAGPTAQEVPKAKISGGGCAVTPATRSGETALFVLLWAFVLLASRQRWRKRTGL